MRDLPKDAELRIAKIEDTELGYEDHGIFTCILRLDYGGSAQGAGLYALDEYDVIKDRRVGTAIGLEFIIRLMRACGVRRWEDLVGRRVYAVADYRKVHAIVPLPTDGPEADGFWFDDLWEEMGDDDE